MPVHCPPELSDRVSRFFANCQEPGIAVSIRLNGELVFAEYRGAANLVTGSPVECGTLFAAGSITKQVIAAALVQHCQREGISLDTPACRFLPALTRLRSRFTLRHLLSHTAGLGASLDGDMVQGLVDRFSLARVIASLQQEQRVATPPGHAFEYRNAGYWLLGHVLEHLWGVPLSDGLRKTVLMETGLTDGAAFAHERPREDRLAIGHVRDGSHHRSVALDAGAAAFGSAGLLVNANALTQWGQALWLEDALGAPVAEEMRHTSLLSDGTPAGYGLGVYVSSLGGHRELSHDGNSSGFSAQLAVYPDDRLVIAVLLNTNSHIAESLEKGLATAILGAEEDTPTSEGQIDFREVIGTYSQAGRSVPVYVAGNTLLIRTPSGRVAGLVPIGSHRFRDSGISDICYEFDVAGRSVTVRRHGKRLMMLTRDVDVV